MAVGQVANVGDGHLVGDRYLTAGFRPCFGSWQLPLKLVAILDDLNCNLGEIVLQTLHYFRCDPSSKGQPGEYIHRTGFIGPKGRTGVRCHMDVVTIAVVGVILVSYLIGTLTSSVDTERELPHRY